MNSISDIDKNVGDGFRINLRAVDPRDPRCPLHLRRVCGVCPHFAGTLAADATARCDHLAREIRADRNPGGCPKWSRRLAVAS